MEKGMLCGNQYVPVAEERCQLICDWQRRYHQSAHQFGIGIQWFGQYMFAGLPSPGKTTNDQIRISKSIKSHAISFFQCFCIAHTMFPLLELLPTNMTNARQVPTIRWSRILRCWHEWGLGFGFGFNADQTHIDYGIEFHWIHRSGECKTWSCTWSCMEFLWNALYGFRGEDLLNTVVAVTDL